ncbi:NAD(+) synthase [Variovorax sp. Sphag1AA]|uniref:NAD(+) synthase n=1 Tax=Variovorax sp. Sphag1AA TaxID=2587027 RepID=UPI0016209F2C|nr:NAD(+) synthase [Variovorax sp. Sphag1AA]MBB3178684.1 NAD+ synthase (glutamine-hydrolyzing) [Variovorax sp. Sphag1AA]
MTTPLDFHNPYRHGFARVAVAVPRNRVADPVFNAAETVRMYREAAAKGAVLVAFPELGLSAYTCDDLFHQAALLDACEAALQTVVEASREVNAVAVVGLPLRVDHRLFNCAAAVAGGRVLGVFPKTYLPNYGEFYEARQFAAADSALATEIELFGQRVPFGTDLMLRARQLPLLKLHVEICEDVWVPIPPSSHAALAGATVLVNLSASNITIGKSAYRHQLVSLHSARCLAAYLYSSAGIGESTTDLAWDGQALIYESGEMLAESERFSNSSHMICADVDLEHLARERMRQNSFGVSAQKHRAVLQTWRTVDFDLEIPRPASRELLRKVERFPYVPADAAHRDDRCHEVFNIQVQSLVQRMEAAGIKKLVIGVSGGLDSTHALLVCAKAVDRLGIPRSNILGYTMPGFATSDRTLGQAHALMRAVGCTAQEIDIRPSCTQMLVDLGHPFKDGVPQYDITFENVQAGERTSHLFRLANHHGGIVVGTGDLSELALGWCTYGVGDHMSHYNVNASVPKTLIKHLVRWVAEKNEIGAEGSRVLEAIVDTEVSPELVPATAAAGSDARAQPGQRTEDTIGPYELQDFHLYYTLRFGFRPTKVAYLAYQAWHDRTLGAWPDELQTERNEYGLAEIRRHLRTFLYRFFKTSQFKRSCVPNAPKVGSGGSLSPRGDWRAPSDSEAAVWMADLEGIPAEAPPAKG